MYVLLYVHGWKHDGRSEDEDLMHFKDLVANLQKKVSKDAHVVGGFIAWPGRSGISPIDENLGFWSRKTASDRVSISSNVAKLLGAVNSVRNFRQEPRDMVVGIGHSFGARILFSSAAYAVLHDSQMKHPGKRGGTYGRISGATDLIILLNPAFEASRYTSIDSLRRPLERFELGQQPVMLTISTTNDYATRFAFPLGQTLSGRWHERERSTVGNYADFVTHKLEHISTPETSEPQQRWWFDEFCHNSICLRRTTEGNSTPNFGNPFIVAQTDASIIKGHNDIWTPAFVEWMTAFVAKTNEGFVADRKRQADGIGTQGLDPSIIPEMGLAPTQAHPLHESWRQ